MRTDSKLEYNEWTGVKEDGRRRRRPLEGTHGFSLFSFEPLRSYSQEDVTLTLPGELKMENIDWVAVYDKTGNRALAYASIPSDLNVPPNLNNVEVLYAPAQHQVLPYKSHILS
jgi:hypothetical protein